MNPNAKTVDEYLTQIPEWQRANLELFRSLVHKVIPDIEEAIKWGVPVFLRNKKMIFAMSSFKAHSKFNFMANGAFIDDPDTLFNNGLDSKKARSIDMHEGDTIDAANLEALIRRAANF